MKRLLFILLLSFSFAATLLVPEEYSIIQNAINASSNSDTVLVLDGIYYENILGDNNITLKSVNGPEVTIIDGLNNDRVLNNFGENINISSTIQGFTIQRGYSGDANGNSQNGAGIYTGRSITIKNCILKITHAQPTIKVDKVVLFIHLIHH